MYQKFLNVPECSGANCMNTASPRWGQVLLLIQPRSVFEDGDSGTPALLLKAQPLRILCSRIEFRRCLEELEFALLGRARRACQQ